ncbi:fructose-bisphosphate aldolase [Kocuria sp. CNJ-770]|uniref:class II fructose-bisphosphate aldolase n=1 Tax=Kocuria sp. CNJ-770 TaxID=1904964 RepID=UPI00096724B3|nr:class II fructose-bisphosphate aldolase [Kocuria sp. CNJ-770]OLT12120.1 fructose-bisphosphate aldolase [Kocuria sp. CNJ-770]
MRANLLDVVTSALAAHTAVPALSTYDFTTAQAVVEASERAGRPVILLVPPKAAAGTGGRRLVTALRALADDAATPVCVQLDHAVDLDLIEHAVAAGADAVLADGSSLPAAANAAFVARARELVGPGVVVEAELGSLPGDEDAAMTSEAGGMTDPGEVPGFLDGSGADLLAVAVGNVHGHYRGTPRLHWSRLEQICEAAERTPLVLHGASGIPETMLVRAPLAGIGKININTELRSAVFAAVADRIEQRRHQGLSLWALLEDWTEAVGEFTTLAHRLTTAEARSRNS